MVGVRQASPASRRRYSVREWFWPPDASGNFTWPTSAATVAQAKLLVYRHRAVRAENQLKPAGDASLFVFPSQFLRFKLLRRPVHYGKRDGPAQPPKWAEYGRR